MEDYLTAGRLVELLDGDPVSGERFHSGARNGLRRFDKFRKLVRSDIEDVSRRRFWNDQGVPGSARHDVEKSERFVVLINLVGGQLPAQNLGKDIVGIVTRRCHFLPFVTPLR